ncbi:hypothetical protein ACVWZM_004711 [Bradyrhizobium sp. USDA 4501]
MRASLTAPACAAAEKARVGPAGLVVCTRTLTRCVAPGNHLLQLGDIQELTIGVGRSPPKSEMTELPRI